MRLSELLSCHREGYAVCHPRNPLVHYQLKELTMMHINGRWVEGMTYTDGKTVYTRPTTEFGKFYRPL